MINVFIPPEIDLTVKRNIHYFLNNEAENLKLEFAMEEGRKFAIEILDSLMNGVQFGKIESHFNTEKLDSENYNDIKESIICLFHQRGVISKEVNANESELKSTQNKLKKIENSFLKILYKKRIRLLKEHITFKQNELKAIKEIENESYLKVNFIYDQMTIKDTYSDLISAFTDLKNSHKIWDMTYSERNLETKAAAVTSMERTEVKFYFDSIKSIRSNEKSFCFENFNGGDFYFYPSFIIYFKNHEDIAFIDYNDLVIKFAEARFLEESDNIPKDTITIGETWYRVNKDGSPDKRFVNNFQIPIVCYGSIQLQTLSGINELYYISDVKKAKHFCEQYNRFQDILQ